MHVSDSQGPPAACSAGKDQVRAAGETPTRGARPRFSGAFRDALERKPRAAAGNDNMHEAASAAAMASWFRSERPRITGDAALSGRASDAATAAGARAVDRVLIGSGPDGAEARIRIGAGALAGTEIQLSGGAGGHVVEAWLLTHAASSRQTLSVVMDEIRSRLRDRGIVLSLRAPGAGPPASPGGADAGEGDAPRLPSRGPAGTNR